MCSMHIRQARPGDEHGIAEIYNDAVRNSVAIWNDETVDAGNRRDWVLEHQRAGAPVLVAVDGDDLVLGYATWSPFRDFDGFRHTIEHSIYVRAGQRGNGIGRQLMEELLTRARASGHHVLIAAIEGGNTASVRLHENLGFVKVGELPEVGQKFGRWLTMVLMQLYLD